MFDAGIDYGLFFAACPLEIGAMVGDLGILAQVTFFNEVPCPHRADCVRKLERGGAINVLAIVVAISTHRSHGSVGIVGRLPSPSGDRFRPDIDSQTTYMRPDVPHTDS